MTFYNTMAADIRQVAKNYRKKADTIEKRARVYDFISTCDKEDVFTLFDSSVFNVIAQTYLRLAVKRLQETGTISTEAGQAIDDEYTKLLDDKDSKRVFRTVYGHD